MNLRGFPCHLVVDQVFSEGSASCCLRTALQWKLSNAAAQFIVSPHMLHGSILRNFKPCMLVILMERILHDPEVVQVG